VVFWSSPVSKKREEAVSLIQKSVLFLLVLVSLQIATPSIGTAKTWFVERDGSGDFIVIQDAVDAAASGDTIKIGLGRFDEQHIVTVPGWSESVRVLVTQNELTIIGSGSETIIGQEATWNPEQGGHKGIVGGVWWGNHVLRIEDVHFENMRQAVYTANESSGGESIKLQGCTFNGNHTSLWLLGDGGTVRVNYCDFQNSTTEGISIVGWNQAEMEIRECDFVRSNYIYSTNAINVSGIQNLIIENCNIVESSVGISISSSEFALVKNCVFDNQGIVALSIPMNSNVHIENCQFRNQYKVLTSATGGNVNIDMVDSIIEDVEYCSVDISGVENLTVHNCDLAKGSRGVVHMDAYGVCPYTGHLDMTTNYWGTTEPDSIDAWIFDRYDSEDACYWIEYEPFETQSTPVEKKSLGGFKAMFR
jgi:hypothetical protein